MIPHTLTMNFPSHGMAADFFAMLSDWHRKLEATAGQFIVETENRLVGKSPALAAPFSPAPRLPVAGTEGAGGVSAPAPTPPPAAPPAADVDPNDPTVSAPGKRTRGKGKAKVDAAPAAGAPVAAADPNDPFAESQPQLPMTAAPAAAAASAEVTIDEMREAGLAVIKKFPNGALKVADVMAVHKVVGTYDKCPPDKRAAFLADLRAAANA